MPDSSNVSIGVNDFVMWHVEHAGAPPPVYYIVGTDGNGGSAFDSRSLGPDDMYSHFFMEVGLYEYDAGGASGEVEVTDHRAISTKKYLRGLKEDNLIGIKQGALDPPKLKIPAGKTLLWYSQVSDVSVRSVNQLSGAYPRVASAETL